MSTEVQRLRLFRVPLPEDVWYWLSVEDRAGLVGWGEMVEVPLDRLVGTLFSEMRRYLVGVETARLIGDRWPPFAAYGNPYGLVGSTVLAGIEQALWDLSARQRREPLSALYGIPYPKAVSLYANLNRGLRRTRSAQALGQRVAAACAAGFSVVKCAPFDEVVRGGWVPGPHDGLNRLRQAAQHLSAEHIAIDCHQRFDPAGLASVIEQWPSSYWVEEPLPISWSQEWVELKRAFPKVRWAGGESCWTARDLTEYAQLGIADVVMPDVKYIGVRELRALIPQIEARGRLVSFHNPTGPIATAHSAHLSLIREHQIPMEFPFMVAQDRSAAVNFGEDVDGGSYRIQEIAGIGLEPDEKWLGAHAEEWNDADWIPMREACAGDEKGFGRGQSEKV